MQTTWTVDPGHSTIAFSVRHLLIANVRGRFARFSGDLAIDQTDLARSSLRIAIDTASIDTDLEQRDTHLKSADFFDVAQFPEASFTSAEITKSGDDYAVRGDLTLRGVTQEVVLQATFGGTAIDARGRERIAFTAKTVIDREAFGVRWNQALGAGGIAIGKNVSLEIDLQAVKA